jgi:signal transduction histidine kinase
MIPPDPVGKLRLLAFIGPVAFIATVSAVAEVVLERDVSEDVAHFIATGVICVGALVFTAAMFEMLARSNIRLQRLARLEERQRIADALHDEVIQGVYGAQLGLEASLGGAEITSDPKEELVHRSIGVLDEVIARVRRHIMEEDFA